MISEDEMVEWVYGQMKAADTEDRDMGSLERTVDRVTLDVRRRVLQRLTQEAADREELGCPHCGEMLRVAEHRRERTVNSSFGPVCFKRSYGLCPHCLKYRIPADVALGLHQRAPSSPRVQEICALMTLRAPAGQADEDVQRLTGLTISASTLHREARRQGERALKLRQKQELLAETADGVAGDGVAQDYAEAVKWYRRAAEQNNAPAQANLGVCYLNGQGVEKDDVEAVKWFAKAVDQNDAHAQRNLVSRFT